MSADQHNRLAREFVLGVAAGTRTEAEMMVVIESALLASMALLNRQYKLKPATCVEMVESAVQAATERFTAMGKRP